jgi:tetratricopeptide (TPR) repeat protein
LAHSKRVLLLQAGLTLVVAGLLAPRMASAACINAALLHGLRSVGGPGMASDDFSNSVNLTDCFQIVSARDHTWKFLPNRVGAGPQEGAAWRQGLLSDLGTYPDDYFAIKALGDAYLASGNLPLALQTFRTIADANVLFSLSQWAYQAGDLQRSKNYSRLAVALAPEWAEAWYQLAEAQFATGDPSALDSYRQVLMWSPAPGLAAQAHMRIGTLLAHQGDRAGALENFQTALTLAPSYASAMVELSRLYIARGDMAQACQWALRARAVAPGIASVVRLLVDVRKVASCAP